MNLLWEKANDYKKVEDWTNLTATLEQLAKLQPNFITFWKFQAWNLTYNVSVEFDDYHDRYYYVRRGIEFLQGRRAVQRRQSAAAVGPGLVHRPEDRPGRRARAISPAVQGGRRLPSGRPHAGRARQLAGRQGVVPEGDRRGRQQGPQPGPQEPARFLFQPGQVADELRRGDRGRRLLRQGPPGLDQGGRGMAAVRQHADRAFHRRQAAARLRSRSWKKKSPTCGPSWTRMLPGMREQAGRGKARRRSRRRARRFSTRRAEKLTPEQAEQAATSFKAKIEVTDRDVAERIAREQPANAKQALQLANELERTRTRSYSTRSTTSATPTTTTGRTRADFEQTDNALDRPRVDVRRPQGVRGCRPADGQEALPGRLRQVAAGDRRVPRDPGRRSDHRRGHCSTSSRTTATCWTSSTKRSATTSRCGT